MNQYDDNSIAFKEEQDNLASVEKRINKIASNAEVELNKYKAELDGFVIYDYDDHSRMITMKKDMNRYQEEVSEYHRLADSPYFGHFEMAGEDDSLNSFYVGKEGLIDPQDARVIILDWRSPMGNTFYNKSERHFKVNGEDYDLLLRRSVAIDNKILKSVKTEYDSVNLSLDGEVIDEFLISVLRDKRRNNKLTDIIRTIQENQNDIIRKPLNESFVVQGCAGSGKTMILLHRLSYIAFNYPNANFDNFYILTPNEFFNLQVNELSQSLGLDKIKRMTVESYYAQLIHSLCGLDSTIVNGKRIPKVSASVSGLSSEKLLNNDMLTYIYSEDYYNELVSEYQRDAKAVASRLNDLGVVECLRERQFKIDSFTEVNYKVFSAMVFALANVKNRNNEAISKLQDAQKSLDSNQKRIDRLEHDLPKKEELLILTKTYLREGLIAKYEELSDSEKQSRDELALKESKRDGYIEEREETLKSILHEKESLKAIDSLGDEGLSYDYISSSTDDVAAMMRTECLSIINEIDSLRAQLDTLAIYNFSKKSRIRKQIEEKEQELSSSARAIRDKYYSEVQAEIEEFANDHVSTIESKIDDLNAEISVVDSIHKAINKNMKECSEYSHLLDSENYPDFTNRIIDMDDADVEKRLNDYKVAYSVYTKQLKDINSSKLATERLISDIEKYKSDVLDEDTIGIIDEALSIIRECDVREISKKWEESLKALYKKYEQKYSSKDVYRHRLYLKLLMCNLYYGTNSSNTIYLNIDEAQDFALVEYKLLSEVLNESAVFNLYGDVNQSVYEYKGISDWDELEDIVSANVYLLNENYRNTRQITDFCNETFEADVTAIGLSGAAVNHLGIKDALLKLEELTKENSEMKAAVIYRRGLHGLRELIEASRIKCVFNTVKDQGISILTVEEAKGLEFGAVVVVENNMTVNEKYIAYTRAMDNLIITQIP